MRDRINFDDGMFVLPLIAFVLTAAAFVFFVVRALRMRPEKRDHAANLPLEGDEPPTSEPDDRKTS
jgi:hypothetical protein